MVSFGEFLFQFYQPCFFYSLVFLSIAFVCIRVFFKANPFMSRRIKSIMYLTPLFVPVFALIFFYPQILISIPLPPLFQVQQLAPGAMSVIAIIQTVNIFSITGLLCLGGAIAATVYLAVTIVFGQRIVKKAFHVVMMSPEEYAPLQEKVKEISRKLGISAPKVGLTEDLRPNAFTLGYGQRTMIVFSLGILNLLDTDELTAVASHELAHVKAKDYLFRSLSYALNVLSFFNPFSYFAVSEAQKERELLADEEGAALLSKPSLMADVLAKLEKVLQVFPKERFINRLSASLFLVSPIARRAEILATHPQIAHRVHNINAVTSRSTKKPRHRTATLLLLTILVFTAVLSGYAAVQIQSSFVQRGGVFITRNPVIDSQPVFINFGLEKGAALPFNAPSLPNLTSLPLQLYGNSSAGNTVLILKGSGMAPVTNESGTMQITNEEPYVIEMPTLMIV
jgi:Zn-dependent protease with chaperone function